MTPPMITAFFAMMAFNLVDTWYVSRLGTSALAAMSFTFPIIMVLHSLAMGIGMGTSSFVSGAIGRGDHRLVKNLTTHALLLGFISFTVIAVAAWNLASPLLSLVGATDEAMTLAADYLRVLLVFLPIGILPMIGNNAIRATGDTLGPSMIMAAGAALNCILDPILIFGWGPVPAMGIKGAALATGLSRLLTWGAAWWVLHHRCRMLTRHWSGWRILFNSWRRILAIAIPSSATNLLMPIAAGIVTRLIAHHGIAAVAATTAGQRIVGFAAIVPIAMGSVLFPIIGQNWGAKRPDRVYNAWATTCRIGVGYALAMLGLSFVFGRPTAALFSTDPDIQTLTTHYLWISLIGGVLIHAAVHTSFAFNAVEKPLYASLLTAVQLVILEIPLAYIGSRLLGIYGIYAGAACSQFLAGLVALMAFPCFLRQQAAQNESPACNGIQSCTSVGSLWRNSQSIPATESN